MRWKVSREAVLHSALRTGQSPGTKTRRLDPLTPARVESSQGPTAASDLSKYKDVFCPVTLEAWQAFWRSAVCQGTQLTPIKGTEPGQCKAVSRAPGQQPYRSVPCPFKPIYGASRGFLRGARGKVPTCQCRRHKRHGFNPWVGKIPWRRAW